MISAEARACGVEDVSVDEADGWYHLSADRDWLASEEEGLRVFAQLVHLPEAGVNASRSEVLLTAFAKVVLTSRDGDITIVTDYTQRADEAVERFADSFAHSARVIVFLA